MDDFLFGFLKRSPAPNKKIKMEIGDWIKFLIAIAAFLGLFIYLVK